MAGTIHQEHVKAPTQPRTCLPKRVGIVNTEEKVPLYAARALSRAIRDRGRANDWYRAFDNRTQDELNGHQHFVTVLEECFQILRDRFEEQVLPSKPGPTGNHEENFMRYV